MLQKHCLFFSFPFFFVFLCKTVEYHMYNKYVIHERVNRDHSPNFFLQTSLLFHKWLAERFNLDDAWIVNDGYDGYKNKSISNALITWIGKFCKFVHKQNCSHDFFYCMNYNIIVQVRERPFNLKVFFSKNIF